jgi:hypothetical protein
MVHWTTNCGLALIAGWNHGRCLLQDIEGSANRRSWGRTWPLPPGQRLLAAHLVELPTSLATSSCGSLPINTGAELQTDPWLSSDLSVIHDFGSLRQTLLTPRSGIMSQDELGNDPSSPMSVGTIISFMGTLWCRHPCLGHQSPSPPSPAVAGPGNFPVKTRRRNLLNQKDAREWVGWSLNGP